MQSMHESVRALNIETSKRDANTRAMNDPKEMRERLVLEQKLADIQEETDQKSKSKGVSEVGGIPGYLSKDSQVNIDKLRKIRQEIIAEREKFTDEKIRPLVESEGRHHSGRTILNFMIEDVKKDVLRGFDRDAYIAQFKNMLGDLDQFDQRVAGSDSDIKKVLGGEKGAFLASQDSKKNEILAQIRKLEEDSFRERMEVVRHGNMEMGDLVSKGNVIRLRNIGQGLAAELEAIRHAAATEKAERTHAFEEEVRNGGGGMVRTAQYLAQNSLTDRNAGFAAESAKYGDFLQHRSGIDSLFGLGANLLGQVGNIPGAVNTPELRRAQYKISQEMMGRSLTEMLDDLAKNRPELGGSVMKGRYLIRDYMSMAMSNEAINRAGGGDEGPLRLGAYQTFGTGYKGLAEVQRSDDFTRQTAEGIQIARRQEEYLRKISEYFSKLPSPTQSTSEPLNLTSGG
jgi:hypothetical protein